MTGILNGNSIKTERTPSSTRDVHWADGLRGLAAVFVVTTHCLLGFALEYATPANEDGSVYLFQLPILRLVASGHTCVSIFFLFSGFVCSLKPLRLARALKPEEAYVSIAGSVFRRVFRLVVPCTIATVISWILAQVDAYGMAQTVGSDWLHHTSPRPSEGLYRAIIDLGRNWFSTWWNGNNLYDLNLWTMRLEMQGSMLLWITLVATATFTIRWRVAVLFSTAFYFYCARNLVVLLFYSGALLADLWLATGSPATPISPTFQRSRMCLISLFKRYWPFPTLIIALFLGSGTDRDANRLWWSSTLHRYGKAFFPEVEVHRAWGAVASILLTLSVINSSLLRRALSHRYLVFLGSISFPMYLLHGILLRSLLVWLFYGFIPQESVEEHAQMNEEGQIVTIRVTVEPAYIWTLAKAVLFLLWFGLLICLSVLWRNRIDSMNSRFTRAMEEIMTGKRPLLRAKEHEVKDLQEREKLVENGDIEKGLTLQ